MGRLSDYEKTKTAMMEKYQFHFSGYGPESTSPPAVLLAFDITDLCFLLLPTGYKSHREYFYCKPCWAN